MSPIKKWLVVGAVAIASMALTNVSFADIVLSEQFNYSDGALIGQGGWTITGTSVVNPLSVASGQVPIASTGQDAFKAFTSTIDATAAGTSMYSAFDFSLSAAQATGDYFVHVSNPAGTTTNFFQRFFARSSGAGFQMGLVDTSGTGSTPTYGTTVLNFNTAHTAVIAWNFVTGANNDTFSLYLDPTDAIEGNNTPYLTHAWTSTSIAEPTALAALNLRQGSSTNAPTGVVDNFIVATTFAEAASIPEPASLALLGVGGLALLRRRRA